MASFRTFHNYTLDRGYGNVVLEVSYYGKDYSTILNSGTDDSIHVFRVKGDPKYILVYSQGRHDYTSLDSYEIGEEEGLSDSSGKKGLIGHEEVYFQGEQAVEVLGYDWNERTPISNAKILYQYLI